MILVFLSAYATAQIIIFISIQLFCTLFDLILRPYKHKIINIFKIIGNIIIFCIFCIIMFTHIIMMEILDTNTEN
jgi:hypothetical protein